MGLEGSSFLAFRGCEVGGLKVLLGAWGIGVWFGRLRFGVGGVFCFGGVLVFWVLGGLAASEFQSGSEFSFWGLGFKDCVSEPSPKP